MLSYILLILLINITLLLSVSLRRLHRIKSKIDKLIHICIDPHKVAVLTENLKTSADQLEAAIKSEENK